MGDPVSKPRIVLATATLILIWGSTWGAIRIGLAGIPPLTGVALRFGLASIVLLAVGRALRVPWQGGDRRLRYLWAVETVFGFSISYGVVYWAEQWVPSGLASVLFATFPLFVALLAHPWLEDERLRARSLAGVLVGFSGVAVIFSDDLSALGGRYVLGASAVFLLSPLAGAVAHVQVKKWGGGIHPLNLTAMPMAGCAVVMGVLAAILERGRPIRFDATSVGAVLYLAIVGSAVTFTVYYWLLARVAATRLSLITYGIPVVAVVLGTVFLDEPFTARTAAGAALIIAGVSLSTKGDGTNARGSGDQSGRHPGGG